MTNALVYAGIGGIMWGFGPFGKKYGVATASVDTMRTVSAVTYLVYAVGTFVFPCCHFVAMDAAQRSATFSDKEWVSRVPAILAAGLCSGFAGPCATYALALAGRNASCLISMVTSGIYSVVAALLIMQVFNEHPGFLEYLSAVLILAGILMMEAGAPAAKKDEDSGESAGGRPLVDEQGQEGGSTWYGATKEWCARATTAFQDTNALSLHALAMFFAVTAGVLWAIGQLGKKYGAEGAEHGFRAARSACTFFVYNVTAFTPVMFYCAYMLLTGKLGCPGEAWYPRAPVVFVCGILSGLGGVMATYAFALAADNESSMLAMIENGMYTCSSALFIGCVYQERLTRLQMGAASLILMAVVCASASEAIAGPDDSL